MSTVATLAVALFLKPALILAGAAGLAAGLRRGSAAARHAVWSCAVLAILALPFLRSVLPPFRLTAPRVWAPPSESAPRDLEPVPTTDGPDRRAVPGSLNPGLDAAAWEDRFGPAMLAVWILGMALGASRRIGAEVRVSAMRRRARPASIRLTRHFDAAVPKRGTSVELRVSGDIASPAVAGFLNPVLLLPDAAETWAAPDLDAVMVHELAHVARRDCMLNLLADVATILYWCNPLVRWGVRRMRVESERACDDRVVRNGIDPRRYAHLLLEVARAHRSRALDGPLTAMARPRELESRLLAVLDPRQSREPLSTSSTMALTGLMLTIALPAAALSLDASAPPARAIAAPEPDRLGDSLSRPGSERLPRSVGDYRIPPAAVSTLDGPDSLLARLFAGALPNPPRHEADLVRDRAHWALSRSRDGRLVDPLLESLRSADWREQAYAAWALGVAREPRAVPLLVPLLGHPVWRLRAMAAYALRESRDPRAEQAMRTALTDPAWQVRAEAVQYVSALGGPSLAEHIRPHLEDRHMAVRLAAARALTR